MATHVQIDRGTSAAAVAPDWHGTAARRASSGRAACRLSIVIPVYNEARTLPELLRRVRAVALPKQIIVVDDGSDDETRAVLDALAGQPDVQVVRHATNQGKGAALKTGFALVRGDVVIVQDADLEYDPADYEPLIGPILAGEADAVFGSRFASGPAPGSMGGVQAWANRVLTRLSNRLTGLGLTDMETGAKVFRRDVVEALAPALRQHRFGIEPELAARLARGGYRVREVPIRYRARSVAEGKKIRWWDGVKALWCIVRYARWG